MMRLLKTLGCGIALALVSHAALAFEIERAGGEAKREAAPKAEIVSPGSVVTTKPGEVGTEVRIPGLGKIGVLPKLDFGLELLYGAEKNGVPRAELQADPKAETDDGSFRIRGSIKHRF
jgi:hypothetical protein